MIPPPLYRGVLNSIFAHIDDIFDGIWTGVFGTKRKREGRTAGKKGEGERVPSNHVPAVSDPRQYTYIHIRNTTTRHAKAGGGRAGRMGQREGEEGGFLDRAFDASLPNLTPYFPFFFLLPARPSLPSLLSLLIYTYLPTY